MPIGELWDCEVRDSPPTLLLNAVFLTDYGGQHHHHQALAEDCAADGRYACFFTSAPLNLRGGVASPANALALK
jgi:hypothetical protein